MLALKLVLTPLLIAAVSLAGRRWGPAVSGWLTGLPLTSGPVVLFLALEQGPRFAAGTAVGTLLGLVSLAAFCLTYAVMSRHAGWQWSTLAGWGSYFALTALCLGRAVNLSTAFLISLAALVITLAIFPKSQPSGKLVQPPSWEIPVRMVAATALVLALTAAARTLGPRLSGLLTPFPVYATILAAFTHSFQDGAAATGLLRAVVTGTFSFAIFFLLVGGTVERWGIAPAFALASTAALLLHGLSLALVQPRA